MKCSPSVGLDNTDLHPASQVPSWMTESYRTFENKYFVRIVIPHPDVLLILKTYRATGTLVLLKVGAFRPVIVL